MTLTKDAPLNFKTQPYRQAKSGETFRVVAHRPQEKRVYLFAKDQRGQDIAVWVAEDVVSTAIPHPPASKTWKPDIAILIGRPHFASRLKPLPEVAAEAEGLAAVGVERGSAVVAEEPRKVTDALMQALAGASASGRGKDIAALLSMIDDLPPDQRLKVQVNGQNLDQIREAMMAAIYFGDVQTTREIFDKTMESLAKNPILPASSISSTAEAMTIRERVKVARSLREEGCCLAAGIQLLPFNRKMLSDVIDPEYWKSVGASDLMTAALRQEEGRAFSHVWRNICTLNEALDHKVINKLMDDHLSFLPVEQRRKFASLFSARITSKKGAWLNGGRIFTDIKDPEMAVDLAFLLVSERYAEFLPKP